MKTLRTLFILLLIAMTVQQSSAQGQEQMQFQNDLREATSGDLGNITEMMTKNNKNADWYLDENGAAAALLRIKVENMPVAEMKKLTFKGSACLKRDIDEQKHEIFVSVGAGGNGTTLEAYHDVFQQSSRLRFEKKLKAGKLYDVTLVNNKTTPISINLKASNAKNVDFYIDDVLRKSSPLTNGETNVTIENMTYGKHSLRISSNNTILHKSDIEVIDGNTSFSFDARKTQPINITSDPDGAAIYVDEMLIGKAPIMNYNIVLGAHTFRAVLNAEQTDEQPITVTQGTTVIDLHPVKKSNVIITTKYSGRPAPATLVVDNQTSYNNMEEYKFVLPYGRHSFRVNYSGKTKEKTININKPETNYNFRLSAKNDFVWPWQREYEHHPMGFSMGYVSKQMIVSVEDDRYKCDPAYKRENKWLSGMQIGFHFQPQFSWGLGLYTGLFFEMYLSQCDPYESDFYDEVSEEYSYFTEYVLNVPIHAYYNLPFSENFSIALHGGIGMDFGLGGAFASGYLGIEDNESGYSAVTDYYGEDNGGPNAVNFTLDMAVSFNIKHVGINAFYSRGLTNHKGFCMTYGDSEEKKRINKFGFSLSYLF